jgi:4-diphosphocytidyl-2-C-methyl-D-erythritol kinase
MATDAGFAPAKVNLYLHVVGRRPDGYHLLDSLVVFADLGDRLTVEPDDRLSLTIDGPRADAVPPGPDNLVLRAAEALRRECGARAVGARIRLTKVLPVAAGIGGGSADAAAALRLLCALWRPDLPPARLHAIASTLGADIPVCLARRPALLAGIGERLTPAPVLAPAWLVLVNPGVPVPTGPIFAGLRGFGPPAPALPVHIADAADLAVYLADQRNDLEPPARERAPVVGTVLTALRDRDGCLIARMSGSGGTCFGLFADAGAAERAAAAIRRDAPEWWSTAAALYPSAAADSSDSAAADGAPR